MFFFLLFRFEWGTTIRNMNRDVQKVAKQLIISIQIEVIERCNHLYETVT